MVVVISGYARRERRLLMFVNFENFIYASKKNFPKNECTLKDDIEFGIMTGEKLYQVLYIDVRFPKEKNITFARPYTYFDGKEFSFGWQCEWSGQVFMNIENSCQHIDECVVGFLPVDEEYVERDRKIFDEFRRKIIKGWEGFYGAEE